MFDRREITCHKVENAFIAALLFSHSCFSVPFTFFTLSPISFLDAARVCKIFGESHRLILVDFAFESSSMMDRKGVREIKSRWKV